MLAIARSVLLKAFVGKTFAVHGKTAKIFSRIAFVLYSTNGTFNYTVHSCKKSIYQLLYMHLELH